MKTPMSLPVIAIAVLAATPVWAQSAADHAHHPAGDAPAAEAPRMTEGSPPATENDPMDHLTFAHAGLGVYFSRKRQRPDVFARDSERMVEQPRYRDGRSFS